MTKEELIKQRRDEVRLKEVDRQNTTIRETDTMNLQMTLKPGLFAMLIIFLMVITIEQTRAKAACLKRTAG